MMDDEEEHVYTLQIRGGWWFVGSLVVEDVERGVQHTHALFVFLWGEGSLDCGEEENQPVNKWCGWC